MSIRTKSPTTILAALALLAVIGLLVVWGGLDRWDNSTVTWAVIGLFLYFVPTLIAVHRQHRQRLPIFALNLLLGWTFIGWVGAIVWSLTAQDRRP